MLSRTRSIFHIEEEGEKNDFSKGVFAAEAGGGLVGLQILIKHGGIDSKVLQKSSILKKNNPSRKHLSTGFLKACFLCSKELSLQKEVYMYRYASATSIKLALQNLNLNSELIRREVKEKKSLSLNYAD